PRPLRLHVGHGRRARRHVRKRPQFTDRLVGSYLVPRSWSNRAAAAGHDPCVPASSGDYFNAPPYLDESLISIDRGCPITTKGIEVPYDQDRTIPVQFFSDESMTSWAVNVREARGTHDLSFRWDSVTGRAGDVRHLTIHRNYPSDRGGTTIVLKSSRGGTVND